jgi:transposase
VFIRRKPNKSGTTSIQIIRKREGRSEVIVSVGCSREEEQLKLLEGEAQRQLESLNPQQPLPLGGVSKREGAALELIRSGFVRAVGPERILGKIFDSIGFKQLPSELFKEIVLARLVYPTSKLKTTEYLLQHKGKEIDVQRIYRFLDKLSNLYQEQVEQIAYSYSKRVLGNNLTVVFYDMTTLHFEAEHEDDLRKIGFSKDGKFQHPQIMLGLLVGKDGYPISYDIFEGNTFEGKTLLPFLQRTQKRFGPGKPTIVADSALLSIENVTLLKQENYEFILGARIKNESRTVQAEILQRATSLKNKQSTVIDKPDGFKLIVDYSEKRARKDANNREKGVARLNAKLRSGKLTKNNLNNRGYNKFLTLEGEVKVSLDSTKIENDKLWDGLKGYLTNSSYPVDEVISNYKQLWKIERAFRVSKTDLRIRPIYHRKRARIEAHICVAFTAYTVFKELERLLLSHNLNISPQKAIELMKTIYQITFFLPDSQKWHSDLFNLSDKQIQLLKIIP